MAPKVQNETPYKDQIKTEFTKTKTKSDTKC